MINSSTICVYQEEMHNKGVSNSAYQESIGKTDKKPFTKVRFILLICLVGFCQNIYSQCWDTIVVGQFHNLGIKTDGTLWAWGNNQYGQLGDGTVINKSTPTQIGSDTNWEQIAGGHSHSMAIKTDGTLWAWGWNALGQLGNGTYTSQGIPIQIGSATNWDAVSCGFHHSIAKKTDGTLWTWGNNFYGQLGNGTTVSTNIPSQMGVANDWDKFVAGEDHTLAIKNNGTLWAWGYNLYGRLGDGTTINKVNPTQIGISTNWATIACGQEHSLGIKLDGTLLAWGRNNGGQLGDGTTINKSNPTQIGTATNWKQVSAGGGHSVATKTNNTIYSWGWNSDGQLGLGTTIGNLTPAQIGTSSSWKYVAAGYVSSYGIETNNAVWSWGSNVFSQLGDGSTIPKLSPNQINTSCLINCNNGSTFSQTSCDTYVWNSTTYTASGSYSQTFLNAAGCDSIVTLNLTINNSTTATVNQTACDSYTWALNGTTYTTSGTYTHLGTNASGCPLTTTLNLTINNSTTSTVTETACDSYTWPLNGTTYTASGTYTYVGTNASGCLLTTTLNLTINNSSTASVTETACDSYTWALNGITYNTSGTYTHVGTNAAGCPLTTTINLTINNSTTATVTETACDSFTWALNGTTYTTSGTYSHVGTNAAGCPFTTTLNLTVNTVNVAATLSGITITANASGASYQWINCNNGNAIIPGATAQSYTATANGSYAVIVTSSNCTDTSACQLINSVGIDELGASNIEVYPNPTSGSVKIILGEHYPSASIQLFNALGQAILHKTYSSTDEITFEIEGAPGVYFLEIESAEQVLGRIRVVKN